VLPTDDSDADAYWNAISLQAETRAASFAAAAISGEFGRTRFVEPQRDKRFFRRRPLDWVLPVALGAALFVAILYVTLGLHLHLNAVEATRELSGKTTLNECCHLNGTGVASP
jgi:hypothetical protein